MGYAFDTDILNDVNVSYIKCRWPKYVDVTYGQNKTEMYFKEGRLVRCRYSEKNDMFYNMFLTEDEDSTGPASFEIVKNLFIKYIKLDHVSKLKELNCGILYGLEKSAHRFEIFEIHKEDLIENFKLLIQSMYTGAFEVDYIDARYKRISDQYNTILHGLEELYEYRFEYKGDNKRYNEIITRHAVTLLELLHTAVNDDNIGLTLLTYRALIEFVEVFEKIVAYRNLHY